MMTRAGTTAVVVRWRGGDEIDRCLRSLLDHGGHRLAHVVLVDSGSGDGGAERIAVAYPPVEVVALPVNRSFASAANEGAVRATGDSLLLLNPDTELMPGSLEVLAGFLDSRPEAAGVVPLLVGPDGVPQLRWQLRRLPTPTRLALGLGGAPQFPAEPPRAPAPVGQPAAAAWLVRRSIWDTLGGFDARFAPAWWEDVDFCARLRQRHHPQRAAFWAVPSARLRHSGGSSLAALTDAEFLTMYYLNLLRYAERHHPDRFGAIRSGLALALRARALARPSRGAAYLTALRAIESFRPDA